MNLCWTAWNSHCFHEGAEWNGARLTGECALYHNHKYCELQTVPNLLVKIELSDALFCQNPDWFYPQPAGKISAPMLKITQFRVINDVLHINEADKRKLDVGEEKKEQKIVEASLAEAKICWRAFNPDSVRRKADDAFDMGTKVKDSLRAKIYPQK
jgi:hypothetical protein